MRLNILVMLTPQFHGVGPHSFSSRFTWPYGGLLVGTDPVAVDATGAGDAFAAGFIAGVWHGWPLEKVARFANAVGALCVTGMGGSGGVTTLDKTLAFMETTETRS